MYKLCVFDMDGTLVNSITDIAYAMNRALKILGYPEKPENEYYQMVGKGMKALCEAAIPKENMKDLDKIIHEYHSYYINHCCEKTRPYDGIVDAVSAIRKANIPCVVLSNKPHEQLLAVINKLFPPNLFTKILGKVDSFPQKPSPESLEYLMHSFNVSKNETIYIGDSNVDMTLGTNAKVQTIGVEWGFRDRTELEEYNATYIVKKPNELFDIVCK